MHRGGVKVRRCLSVCFWRLLYKVNDGVGMGKFFLFELLEHFLDVDVELPLEDMFSVISYTYIPQCGYETEGCACGDIGDRRRYEHCNKKLLNFT